MSGRGSNGRATEEAAERLGKRGRSGEYALRVLREAILEGRYGPADKISQEQLADELSLSRSPVREALRQLDREGLVRLIPNTGAEVVAVDPSALVEIYRLREKLDPIALADCVERLSDTEIEALTGRLASYCEEMESLPVSQSKRFEQLDRQFHFEARALTHPRQFRELLDGLWNVTVLGRNRYWLIVSSHEITNMEHRLILDAIQRRAASDAYMFLKIHINRTLTAIQQWVAEYAKDEPTEPRSDGMA